MSIPTTAIGSITIPFNTSNPVHGADAAGALYPITAIKVDPKDAGTIGKAIADAPRALGYWDITPYLSTMRSHLRTAGITAAAILVLTPTALKWAKEKAEAHPIQWSLWDSNKTELAKNIFDRGCIEISQHPYRTALACLGIASIGYAPTIASGIYNTSKKTCQFIRKHPLLATAIAATLASAGTALYFREDLVKKVIKEQAAESIDPIAKMAVPTTPTIFSIGKKALKSLIPDISKPKSWFPELSSERLLNCLHDCWEH